MHALQHGAQTNLSQQLITPENITQQPADSRTTSTAKVAAAAAARLCAALGDFSGGKTATVTAAAAKSA